MNKSQQRHALAPFERLHANETLSLEQVAMLMNVSRERVRQIEAEALRKLGLALTERGLTLDDLLRDAPDAMGLHRRRIHRGE